MCAAAGPPDARPAGTGPSPGTPVRGAAFGALLLVAVVCAVLAAAGWQATVVTSGSMAPRVHPGDLTLTRPVDAADLTPGQVLLVDDPDSPGGLRLHRLVSLEDGGLRLQGDANPTPDTSLVDPSAVHGVGTVRLPGLGLPVLWASQHPWLPGTAVTLGLAALAGLAILRRSSTPSRRVTAWRTTAVLTVAVLLPGTAAAAYTATTTNGPVDFRSANYYSCASAAAGENALQYLDMQEASGTVAVNRGTVAGNGSYVGGVAYRVPGPACNNGASRAVQLNGTSGLVQSSVTVSLTTNTPFSMQLWFSTTTTRGGYLIGFGTGTNGAASPVRDRAVYMTNSGHLRFGFYDGTYRIAPITPARYNDGGWHMLTATFEPGTETGDGLRLFVDAVLVAELPAATTAPANTGRFRAGYDDLTGWADAPTSNFFAGSIAHMAVFGTRLQRATVAEQYAGAN
jgi:signal peptidase I